MMENGQDEERQLLDLLAKGDENAFRSVFSRYSHRVYSTAFSYLRSAALAEEMVQDIFMKVWMKKDTLPQLRSFEAWLVTVAKNHILHHIEKLATERQALHQLIRTLPHSENQAADLTESRQYHGLLQKAIGSLSPMQKDVYQLVREEELSYEQTGRQLGISALTVKTHMSRALRHIRHFLHQHGALSLLFLFL